MAGTIKVQQDVLWSTSSWMFDFIVRSIAADVRDPELAGELLGIQGENLRWLSLPDLPDAQRAEVNRVISECLICRTENDLPAALENREGVLEYVQGLVDVLAGKPLDQVPGHSRRRRRP
jgi:hypothetical protein